MLSLRRLPGEGGPLPPVRSQANRGRPGWGADSSGTSSAPRTPQYCRPPGCPANHRRRQCVRWKPGWTGGPRPVTAPFWGRHSEGWLQVGAGGHTGVGPRGCHLEHVASKSTLGRCPCQQEGREEGHRQWGLPGPALEESQTALTHSIGQNSGPWQALSAQDAGKCSPLAHRLLGSVVPNTMGCWEA